MGVICGGAIVVGHTRTTRLTVVDPRRRKLNKKNLALNEKNFVSGIMKFS